MKKLTCFILCLLTFTAGSQNGSKVFNDTIIHELFIETDLINWFDTLGNDFTLNLAHPDLYPERYHSCNVRWDGTLLSNCGFREKGNASNTLTNFGKKKPLKISIDQYSNQSLDGLKKINLNNFTNDPTLLHDVVCLKLLRDAGIPSSRTSYTKVWVNQEYIGLYLVIENVDKTFLKAKFGGSKNDGNLYKTDRGASVPLDWKGTDKAPYESQGLKLTTNNTLNDWTKLINFIDHINNDHSDNFREYLENNFDVHSYLKILAIEKCVRSWDSYWGGGNNFFIYEHPDGRFRWIPWDMNETFQDIKVLSGTDLLTGYLVPANKFDQRPLLKRIFEIKDYKDEYLNNVCELIQTNFTLNHLGKYMLDRHKLIDETYNTDPNRYNTYGSFKNSLTQTNEDDVSLSHSGYLLRIHYPGMFPFITSQRKWAVEQMSGWDYKCEIDNTSTYNLTFFPNPTTDYVNIFNDPAASFEYAAFYLYDFTGKLCLMTKYEAMYDNYYTLRLDGISSGIYTLLKRSADGKLGRGKIVIL